MGVCVCKGRCVCAVLTLELSEQMGDGKGHRLRGMCCLLEEDEASAAFGNEEVRLRRKKKRLQDIYIYFFSVYIYFFSGWLNFCWNADC